MVNGDDAVFSPSTIEGANITLVDVQTANGVIHVIDAVLTPTSTGDEAAGTAGAADGEGDRLDPLRRLAILIAAVVSLIVVRLLRRTPDGLESIQALGKTDVASSQFATSTSEGQATHRPTRRPHNRRISNKPTSNKPTRPPPTGCQPARGRSGDRRQRAECFLRTRARAAGRRSAGGHRSATRRDGRGPTGSGRCAARFQAAAAQPVAQPTAPAAEPTIVNQWTDETGHTWRIMSDGSYRWWNGTDWQMV